MNWTKTKWWTRFLFPNYIWKIPNTKNKVYLTFDDGPIPEITEWVLDLLKKENIKATFFCIGNNIRKHPKIFNRIITENHSVGNHTFNHLNGWKTTTKKYLKNIELCQKDFFNQLPINNQQPLLFRPPYGKIKPWQSNLIRKKGFQIIMWDVLSYDFKTTISPEKCLDNVIQNTENGSIIVFHDSLKAAPNLKHTLPRAIQILKEKGFVFDKLT